MLGKEFTYSHSWNSLLFLRYPLVGTQVGFLSLQFYWGIIGIQWTTHIWSVQLEKLWYMYTSVTSLPSQNNKHIYIANILLCLVISFSAPSLPATTDWLHVTTHCFLFHRILYEWNYIVCTLFLSVFFHSACLFEIHPCCSIYQ